MLFDKFYSSHDILHGKKIKQMFSSLCEQIIKDDKKTLDLHNERFHYYDSPLFNKETQAVPIVTVSLNKIDAECIFPEFPYKSKGIGRRFIDLYFCYNKEEYFMEVKHGWYCLSEGTSNNIHYRIRKRFAEMLKQIKQNREKYKDREYIHFGFMPIVCYTAQSKSKGNFTVNDILEEFHDLIGKRSGMQMLGFNYEIENSVIKSRKEDKDKPNVVYQIIFLGLFQSQKNEYNSSKDV